MTIDYTALQAAIADAETNTTNALALKLDRGTNSTPAFFPGGFVHYSNSNRTKNVTLSDPDTLTHDYREGSVVEVTSVGNITGIVLTNVPYTAVNSTVGGLAPFTLIFQPSGSTTAPNITSINGVATDFSKFSGSAAVSDPERVVVEYKISLVFGSPAQVYYTVHPHL